MKIKVGDKVETIDDNISGIVTRVTKNTIAIETQDGFELEFEVSELMLIETDEAYRNSLLHSDIASAKKEKEIKRRKPAKKLKPKEQNQAKLVVDLHIHHLTDSTKGMTNFDMLNLKIDTARGQLEFAITQRILKIVFIHGVGEGVLRQELETLLRRYSNVDFYVITKYDVGL